MRSHEQIIREVGAAEMGRRLGVDQNTVYAWVRTKSIPAAYWRAVVAEGFSTFEELAECAEQRRRAACPDTPEAPRCGL